MSTSTRPPHLGVTESLPRMVRRLGLRPPLLPPALARQLPAIIEPLTSLPPVRRLASKMLINYYSYATSLRPRALSMASDYTTWTSLTDRKFTGRHLPPADPEFIAALPSESDVNALYRREQEIKSADTSVWFMFFAQWFVDSFLRTSREDFRQNTSTQEIDLCQIYGLGPAQTRMLRSLSGGRLKSQLIDGEEYPVFLFQERKPGEPLAFKPEFDGLFDERFVIDTILGDAPDERKDSVFAVGLEHGNSTIGNTILNTLFVREHNRIAGVLQSRVPGLGRRPHLRDHPADPARDRAQARGRGVHPAHRPVRLRHRSRSVHRRRGTLEPAEPDRHRVQHALPLAHARARRDRGWRRRTDASGLPQQQPAGHLARSRVPRGAVLQGARRQDRAGEHPEVPGRPDHTRTVRPWRSAPSR